MLGKKFIFGGDYNPDQWPEEVWSEDARLMKEAGVNLVSLGIFSWAKLEPKSGVFDFAWLDRLMDLLHAHGISVNLATPTASPPAWMIHAHPDMLPVNADGVTLWHGSRRYYCPHSPEYHQYAARIATKLAERYKEHPALAMWHVDNEYGCHATECFCDHSAEAFRVWLKERYTSLEQLNFAWGTAFWGQTYSDWQEIHPPKSSPAQINPTQQLDWARFTSDSYLNCFDEQKAILQSITPKIPITTNFMCFHKGVDYFKFAKHEDVVSNDSYPDTSQPDWMIQAGMACDLMRSIGERKPWILMEQATSQVNWRSINAVKRPGIMRLGSLQAAARGADGIMFFQWRQSKAGAEKHHSAMLPHAGTETRVWREVKSLGNELPRLQCLLDSKVEAEAAIVMDWENWWALEIDSKPFSDLKMIPQLYTWYRHFYNKHITVDLVHPNSDLSRYKLVIAPNLYLVNDASAQNLNQYVNKGGTLLLTFFSGIVDENEHICLDGYPEPFRKTLGINIEEYAPMQRDQSNLVKVLDGKEFGCSMWADIIEERGAEVLATFGKDYFADMPAVTRAKHGSGTAYYLGTQPDEKGIDWLLDLICKQSGVSPIIKNLPEGVEVLQRSKDKRTWLFMLNYNDSTVSIAFGKSGCNLLTGDKVNQTVELSPNGAAVIEVEQ